MHAWKLALTCAAAAVPAFAQFAYPDCDALSPADFKVTDIFNRSGTGGAGRDATLFEPVQFQVHGVKNADGSLKQVDIFLVERGGTSAGRKGKVKYWDGAAKTMKTMGEISVKGDQDSGLMGIGVHPDFDSNRWIFVWYVPPLSGTSTNRRLILERITVAPDYTFGARKVLLNLVGSKTDNWHSGGPMMFDSYKDLWISIGNNSNDIDAAHSHIDRTDSLGSDEWGASNTHSMRGGAIRIHPDDSEKGYSIPAGNFGEYWAGEWEKQGKTALAAEYRNPGKVLPEVYVKGERSNYSIGVHPTKRWLGWGTVNYQSSYDEFNLVGKPSFMGFPYFHANNVLTPGVQQKLGGMSAAAPKNTSPLSGGVDDLPPAIPGEENDLANTAIGGPIYVFDRSLKSDTKFPPHFHNTMLGWGCFPNTMYVFNIDSNTVKFSKTTQVNGAGKLFANLSLRRPLAGRYGPEGSLYVLNYDGYYNQANNPGISRVDYTGSCRVPVSAAAPRLERQFRIELTASRLVVREAGTHELTLYDVSGDAVAVLKGGEGAEYSLERMRSELKLGRGVHVVSVKTARGTFVRNVSFL